MSRVPPTTAEARAILAGDRRSLARVISRVESRDPAIVPTLRSLYPRSGRARIVGITGPLGVGKSSLINGLLQRLRASGRTVGVVAVDPSSPFSGGSVLGDRIRLEREPGDDGVFVRSMASRGHAGGVAAATLEVARLLDCAGFEIILVETVGSGQVDVEIREIASTSVVVLVPHLGDEVQTMKAGLFEIADVFCVNKSDLPGAETAAKDLRELASLGSAADAWRPEIVLTSSREGKGLEELWASIERHESFLDSSGGRPALERRRAERELEGLLLDRDRELWRERFGRDAGLRRLLDAVVRRELDPHTASERAARASRPPRRGGAR